MIVMAIKGEITNIFFKELSLHQWEYEWADAEGVSMTDGPTMPYLIFKNIQPSYKDWCFKPKY